MIKVLFVCLGNICRSPMADAIFRDRVAKTGLSDRIRVDSAGTGGWHVGERSHPGTRAILKKHHIHYDGRARQFKSSDLEMFDYILAMDRSNLSGIKRYVQQGISHQPEINLFLHYAKQAGTVKVEEVPDPYYDDSFQHVYELVDKGCTALLDHIRAEHQL